MTSKSDIEWEPSRGDRSYFGSIDPETEIDYKKDWKHFVITDKKKLDKIAIEIFKKFYYCLGYKVGAKVEFVDPFDTGHYEYDVWMRIYNIPTEEKVAEVYDYIKKKSSKGFITSAVASYDKKYKYILQINSKTLSVSIPTVKKTKVSHKEVKGVYDYKDAVKRFGNFGKVVDEVFGSEGAFDKCTEIDDEYAKRYKFDVTTGTSGANLIYRIINIPPDKLEGYVNKIEEPVGYPYGVKYPLGQVNIINKSTIEVILEVEVE